MSELAQKRIRLDYGQAQSALPYDRDVEWRFPRIEARFHSPLLNDDNWAYSGRNHGLVARVQAELKPVAFEEAYDYGRQLKLLTETVNGGGAASLKPVDLGNGDIWFLAAAVGGRLNERFDLEALQADYHDYCRGLPSEVYEDIARELDRIRHYHVADFLDFKAVEVDFISLAPVKRRPGSLARCGLLLGYPVETTAALLCSDWGLAGAGSFDVLGDGHLVRSH